jgi:hypothetical protein
MWVILGAVFGGLLMWFYQSGRAREEAQRRLSAAPESLRQAATSARTISADQFGRVAHAVSAAPVPLPVRDALGRATTVARSTAERLGGTLVGAGAATTTASEDTVGQGDVDLPKQPNDDQA